jgi:hypothetical protein
VVDQADPPPAIDFKRIVELAFDPSKPSYYANIFYISGTQNDLRIAFGTTRPIEHGSNQLIVDKFDVSIILPHRTARELVQLITTMLERAG